MLYNYWSSAAFAILISVKTSRIFIFIGVIILVIAILIIGINREQEKSLTATSNPEAQIISGSFDSTRVRTDAEWKKILTTDQYHILREAGTEIPFTGVLNHETRKGTYYSVGCDIPIFRSEAKYDSGTGWPSFWQPISEDALVLRNEPDGRIEVLDKCGGHLGHVFDDGPPPTGKRYCMNSLALKFIPDN